jgi:hypothetical protein
MRFKYVARKKIVFINMNLLKKNGSLGIAGV